MTVLLAYLHYVTYALAFAGIFYRSRQLRELVDGKTTSTRNLFFADRFWKGALLIIIGTGLMRAFGPYEKGPEYYMHNHWFYLKMLLFVIVILLEIKPMCVLIKWRKAKKTEITSSDIPALKTLKKLTHIQVILMIFIPIAASVMARGGFR